MENNSQKFEYASAISLACYVAMALAVVTFLQDFRLETGDNYWQFGKGWIHKIPEWLITLLSCGCWCAIFLGVGNYCKKIFNFQSSLFTVLAGLEVAIFLLFLFIEDSESFVVIGLYFLTAIAYCVIMLITSIQINKTNVSKYISTAFIIYSVTYLVFVLLLPAIVIDAAIEGSEEIPAWIIVGSLITELIPLYLINKSFGKMVEKEDLDENKNYYQTHKNQ
jgi:hypothetical protein